MAAPTENTDQRDQSSRDAGRFFEIQQELSSKRRGPYQLTADILIQPITRRQMRMLREEQDEDKQLAIVLGEHYEAVEELFADRPLDEWLTFQDDLNAFFFGEGAAELPGGSEGS